MCVHGSHSESGQGVSRDSFSAAGIAGASCQSLTYHLEGSIRRQRWRRIRLRTVEEDERRANHLVRLRVTADETVEYPRLHHEFRVICLSSIATACIRRFETSPSTSSADPDPVRLVLPSERPTERLLHCQREPLPLVVRQYAFHALSEPRPRVACPGACPGPITIIGVKRRSAELRHALDVIHTRPPNDAAGRRARAVSPLRLRVHGAPPP